MSYYESIYHTVRGYRIGGITLVTNRDLSVHYVGGLQRSISLIEFDDRKRYEAVSGYKTFKDEQSVQQLDLPGLACNLVELLPVRTRPFKGEYLYSWMARLAKENGLDGRQLYKHIFGRKADVDWASLRGFKDFKALSDATGIRMSELGKLSFEGEPSFVYGIVRLQGGWWKAVMNNPDRPNPHSSALGICFSCLREDDEKFVRRAWLRPWIDSCLKHGTKIYRKCPSCFGSFLKYDIDRLLELRCPSCEEVFPSEKSAEKTDTGMLKVYQNVAGKCDALDLGWFIWTDFLGEWEFYTSPPKLFPIHRVARDERAPHLFIHMSTVGRRRRGVFKPVYEVEEIVDPPSYVSRQLPLFFEHYEFAGELMETIAAIDQSFDGTLERAIEYLNSNYDGSEPLRELKNRKYLLPLWRHSDYYKYANCFAGLQRIRDEILSPLRILDEEDSDVADAIAAPR